MMKASGVTNMREMCFVVAELIAILESSGARMVDVCRHGTESGTAKRTNPHLFRRVESWHCFLPLQKQKR
jgi:hypothetical protein